MDRVQLAVSVKGQVVQGILDIIVIGCFHVAFFAIGIDQTKLGVVNARLVIRGNVGFGKTAKSIWARILVSVAAVRAQFFHYYYYYYYYLQQQQHVRKLLAFGRFRPDHEDIECHDITRIPIWKHHSSIVNSNVVLAAILCGCEETYSCVDTGPSFVHRREQQVQTNKFHHRQ